MKSLFMFTSDQRKGIFAFLLLIVILQLAFFFMDFSIPTNKDPEEQKWLSLQSEVDSLKNASKNKSENVFLFNDSLELFNDTGVNTGVNVGNIGYSILLKLGVDSIYLLGFDACIDQNSKKSHSTRNRIT